MTKKCPPNNDGSYTRNTNLYVKEILPKWLYKFIMKRLDDKNSSMQTGRVID